MTVDKQLKQSARQLAAAEGISYQDALYRVDPDRANRQAGAPGIFTTDLPDGPVLTWSRLSEFLDEAEADLRDEDPYRRAAVFEARARLYNQLAYQTSEPTYKAACYRAAICDDTTAAEIRFEHRIPVTRPKSVRMLLRLRICEWCGRPWQADPEGACPHCPRLLFGSSPSSSEEAAKFPGGQPVGEAPAGATLREVVAGAIEGAASECGHGAPGCRDCIADAVVAALAGAAGRDETDG